VAADDRLRDVLAALRRDDMRLLTLVGPPGSGKSWLALAAAEALRAVFANGVYRVDLSAIRDPHLVGVVIAQVLGVSTGRGRRLEDALQDWLHAHDVLLVLDNLEHLLPAGSLVADLVASCPRLKVLATSRVPLRLSAEHQFPIPPLEVPDLRHLPPLDELARTPAVALFTWRAQAVRPDWALCAENGAAVAEICARVDGLPLAIELAAAWVKLLPPELLLPQLDQALDLLVAGGPARPEWHRSLRAAIARSYELLGPAEQALFRRLGVFVGGCTLEAVTAVGGPAPREAAELLPALRALVEASLLGSAARPDGTLRFSVLQTIRDYALEQLASTGELAAARRRHAEFFVQLAEQAERALNSPAQAAWLDRLEHDADNLQGALDWCITSGETGAVELGLRLGAALWLFWDVRGDAQAGRERLRDLLGLPAAQAPTLARARALQTVGWAATVQGFAAEALTGLEESVALARTLHDRGTLARSLAILGLTLGWNTPEPERAVPFLEEALQLAWPLEDTWSIGLALLALGWVAVDRGDEVLAERYLEEALAVWRRTQNAWGVAYTLHILGFVALAAGDLTRAARLQQESLTTHRALGRTRGAAVCVIVLAAVAVERGQMERAVGLLALAQALCDEASCRLPPALASWHAEGLRTARAALGASTFLEVWAKSRQLPLEEALAVAIGSAVPRRQRSVDGPAELSSRELQVVQLVAEGLSDRQIAARLAISPRTVDNHLRRIFGKVGVSSRTALATWALRSALVA
jgi:non-specific serine/threonine protein kinase